MPTNLQCNSVNREAREHFINHFPCFSSLTAAQCAQLAALMQEVSYLPQEKIVLENEMVDSIFIIVQGEAEVTHSLQQAKKITSVPVAMLTIGEAIGLNDTGFYSDTGKRTATVTAITSMLLLRLTLQDLYTFLQKNNLESAMSAASLQMLRMRFIKQSLPFSRLSNERLRWLADHVEEMTVAAGSIIFHQGDVGDKCYLIRSGQVEIVVKQDNTVERQLAVLKSPMLFGEATFMAHATRNATARALDSCELLLLRYEYLSELIESEKNVANMFMNLMVDRSRPKKNSHVSIHQRTSVDGQVLTILKNPEANHYFKLSAEGLFIWQQLDGQHTLQDITLNLAEHYKIFAPDKVVALISKLMKAGFVQNEAISGATKQQGFLWDIVAKLRRLLEFRIALGDADQWLTVLYQKYVCYLFTRPTQIILALLSICGFIAFITTTKNVLTFFHSQHVSLLLILGLFPFSLVAVMLHEFGHAFAVKAVGREVHYMGVGWYWLQPIAFTDTSDMWLAARKPRMLVNLAGVYVDSLVAGCSALLIFILPNPYVQAMLWLFALYTYIGGFRMLSPLQEMDGYYLLMDWVDKNHLRQAAVLWLIKIFPKSFREPRLFNAHGPEIIYWLACLVFLILVSILTLVVQTFIFKAIGITVTNIYISLILPFLMVVISCVRIFADIRKQTEDENIC